MTSPPSPPNRRRRRIVVITIAVLVLALGWWFWPRVDPRLIGMWEREPSGGVFVFQSSGQFEHFAKDGTQDEEGRWWVDGNQLILRPWPAGLFDLGVVNGLQRFLNYARRRTNFSAYELFSVSDSVVHLNWESPPGNKRDMILGRISE